VTDRRLRRILFALTIVGIGVAGYLSYIHFQGIKSVCLIAGGCEKVQESQWAWVNGVKNGFMPVAYVGLGGYLLIFGSLFVKGETGRFITVALAVPGWAFSAYLTYRELFDVKAICQWCVSSFVIITLVMIFAVWRLLKGGDEPLAGAPPEAELAQ
jgi:uncharacterized membrane protein